MPPQNPSGKIEELRARLKAEPKSRHFYPLGEELRKVGKLDEAESTLREGLQTHGSYLSAWISLGRVLKEAQKYNEALEALNKAFTLDAGNVVTARLLADTYHALNNPVEAIKKYKLVRALLPAADEEVEEKIDQLDRLLNPPAVALDTPAEAQVTPPPTAAPVQAPAAVHGDDTIERMSATSQIIESAGESPAPAFEEAAAEPFEAPESNEEEPPPALVAEAPSTEPAPFDAPFSDALEDTADEPVRSVPIRTMDEPFGKAMEFSAEEEDVFSQTKPLGAPRRAMTATEESAFAAEAAEPIRPVREVASPVVEAPSVAAQRTGSALDNPFERTRAKIRRLQDWLERVKG